MDELVIFDDKMIKKFPLPYHKESSPYLQNDFSSKTYQKCFLMYKEKNIVLEWIKIGKVIILGDVSVGKTSIVNRFCRKMFDSNYKSTIGVDFEVEKFNILGVPYSLQIWDTAGQERFKSIAQSYYRGAHAIVIVFDLSETKTLQNSKKWLIEALNANTEEDPLIFLVGTKRDLINNLEYRQIKESAIKMAKQLDAEYWSVSSKTGKNINKLFGRIATLTFDELITKCSFENGNIRIGDRLIGVEARKTSATVLERSCC